MSYDIFLSYFLNKNDKMPNLYNSDNLYKFLFIII